jgi:hypothetical protein
MFTHARLALDEAILEELDSVVAFCLREGLDIGVTGEDIASYALSEMPKDQGYIIEISADGTSRVFRRHGGTECDEKLAATLMHYYGGPETLAFVLRDRLPLATSAPPKTDGGE